MTSISEENVNEYIEYIFGFTLQDSRQGLLLVKEFNTGDTNLIKLDSLEQILFERLLITENIQSYLIGSSPIDSNVTELNCWTYLIECYRKVACNENSSDSSSQTETIKKTIIELIIRNICTALKQPSLYETQNLPNQIIETFKSFQFTFEQSTNLFNLIVNDYVKTENEDQVDSLLLTSFEALLLNVQTDLSKSSLQLLPMYHFDLLFTFSQNEYLTNVLVTFNNLVITKKLASGQQCLGYEYEKHTLFGTILSISVLPNHSNIHRPLDTISQYISQPFEYSVSASGFQHIQGTIWLGLDTLITNVHKLFHQILKTKKLETRNKLLSWIGDCLDKNIKRGKLWNVVNTDIHSQLLHISDAMAFNLTAVLLHLSKPIVQSHERYLKIDPTYCSYKENPDNFGIHVKCLNKETCLVPTEENETRIQPIKPLTFITQCYWMTQRAIDLGIRVMTDKLTKIFQDLGRLQSSIPNIEPDSPVFHHIKETLQLMIAYKSVLLHPSTLQLLSQFQLATSDWMLQILQDIDHDGVRETHAPLIKRQINFPLPEKITPALKCIPEFVIENFWSYLYLVRYHKTYLLEEMGNTLLEPLLTFILAFMGSNTRIKNPHLRAKLAESLECLLPVREEDLSHMNPNLFGNTLREKLFHEHPHRSYIVESILSIFVGIEMTGESVQFEQKFNYRRPMYSIMEFLWDLPEHRAQFVNLARYAEENMNSDQPPLFLRFVNLLINDAVFLLDEALSNMAQIRTLQSAQENGEWETLPPDEREQNRALLQHTGMIARFDNILGNETIHTLEYLCSQIKTIFCHSTMVDRITSMLNYFLYHLVGPKKKNFKVKDMQDYKFSPATVVLNICKIYAHLGEDDNFCAAVSRDGRSYSPQLFKLAESVLTRIGGGYLIESLYKVLEKVERLGAQQKSDEELLAEAPDEYLDPIMNTLMKEPVILPSSKQTVDKSTIARHLLSDQSDPFNRSPLTIDQVIPNTKLQQEIEKWIQDVRNKSCTVQTSAESSSQQQQETQSNPEPTTTNLDEKDPSTSTES